MGKTDLRTRNRSPVITKGEISGVLIYGGRPGTYSADVDRVIGLFEADVLQRLP